MSELLSVRYLRERALAMRAAMANHDFVDAIDIVLARVVELESSNEIASDRMQILCREKVALEELLQEADAGTNRLIKQLEEERESHGKLNMELRIENRGLRTEVENARAAVERVVEFERVLDGIYDVLGRKGDDTDPTEMLALACARIARVKELEARNIELYEAMRLAEDVGVDEGLFDEDERMTERLGLPMSAVGIESCRDAAELADLSEKKSDG